MSFAEIYFPLLTYCRTSTEKIRIKLNRKRVLCLLLASRRTPVTSVPTKLHFQTLYNKYNVNRLKPIPRHTPSLRLLKPKLSVRRSRLLQRRKLFVSPPKQKQKQFVSRQGLMLRSRTSSHAGWRCAGWKSHVSKRLATRLSSCPLKGPRCKWAMQWQSVWQREWAMTQGLDFGTLRRVLIYLLVGIGDSLSTYPCHIVSPT